MQNQELNMGNMFFLKKRMRPEWYLNGEVTVFNAAQVTEWESSEGAKATLAKMEEYRQTDIDTLKYLDSKKSGEAELEYKEVMKGYKG